MDKISSNFINDIQEEVKEDFDYQKFLSQQMQEIKNEPEVYEKIQSLGLTNGDVRTNIARLIDFKDCVKNCKNCPGLDKCPNKNKGMSLNISFENSRVDLFCEPCKIMSEKILRENQFVFSDFPEEWKQYDIKTLDISEKRKPLLKEYTKFFKGKSNRWIYIYGNHKIGKSYFSAILLNHYLSNNKCSGAFISAPIRFRELCDLAMSKNKEEFANEMEQLQNVEILVIDDFGSEYKNELVRDQIVYPLLSERSKNNKITVFTSNFKLNEIGELYTIGKNTGSIMAEQLVSLISDNAGEMFDLANTIQYKK